MPGIARKPHQQEIDAGLVPADHYVIINGNTRVAAYPYLPPSMPHDHLDALLLNEMDDEGK